MEQRNKGNRHYSVVLKDWGENAVSPLRFISFAVYKITAENLNKADFVVMSCLKNSSFDVLLISNRYEECKEKLVPFLKKVGFNPKKDIHFMPCSGLTGANLKEQSEFCPWYMYVS